MAHVTEPALKAWKVGWHDAADDASHRRLAPASIGKHPSAYILGYFACREAFSVHGRHVAKAHYDTYIVIFMENYDL